MRSFCPFRGTTLLAVAAFAVTLSAVPVAAIESNPKPVVTSLATPLPVAKPNMGKANTAMAPAAPSCVVPTDLVRFGNPLTHFASRLKDNAPLKIVAIGSSSTAGAGASSPAASYPNQLQAELTRIFPEREIAVLNRGANGEEAPDMLARLDESVISEHPDLVIWQIGTNAILRDHVTGPSNALIQQGIDRMKASGADVILIDPQFAPKVLAKAEAGDMVDMLETTAKRHHVNLFHRFAVMRHWRQSSKIPYEKFLSPDELHMNDWSYHCLAKLLASAIAESVSRPTVTVTAVPPVR